MYLFACIEPWSSSSHGCNRCPTLSMCTMCAILMNIEWIILGKFLFLFNIQIRAANSNQDNYFRLFKTCWKILKSLIEWCTLDDRLTSTWSCGLMRARFKWCEQISGACLHDVANREESLSWTVALVLTVGKLAARKEIMVMSKCQASFQTLLSARYLEVARRYNYTTAKSFLELISLFKTLLASKRAQLSANKSRLQSGVEKISQASAQVRVLSLGKILSARISPRDCTTSIQSYMLVRKQNAPFSMAARV